MTRSERLEQIYTIVAQIPAGRVTTYGRVAKMTDGATARMVAGRALPFYIERVVSEALFSLPPYCF